MSKKKADDSEKRSGAEKPVSLDPLDFEEALSALLQVRPEDSKGQQQAKADKKS